MTSTSFNVGMNQDRNSSRVLRPPGGGSSDVLGLRGEPNTGIAKKGNPRNVSSITEGTDIGQPPREVKEPAAKPPPPPAPATIDKPPEAKPVPTPTFDKPQAAPPAPKGRVPPGGFSSGLW